MDYPFSNLIEKHPNLKNAGALTVWATSHGLIHILLRETLEEKPERLQNRAIYPTSATAWFTHNLKGRCG